jgi:hypothetical protein
MTALHSFLVIRVGKVYDLSRKAYITQDPIVEVDKVLAKYDTCFFAKFGKKLNTKKINELAANKSLYLVVVINHDGNYLSKTYKIKIAMDQILEGAKNYPAYYAGKEDFIGTWLEVTTSELQASLGSLYVTSSYQKLAISMSTSMSSFFFCRL